MAGARILVVLPSRRRWAWQDRLVARLGGEHEVSVAVSRSPALPLSLRLWLAFAARLFPGSAKPFSARPTEPAGDGYDIVIDLSEGGGTPEAGLVLRPLHDGTPDTMALVARLLARQCPMIEIADSGGRIVAGSYPAIEDKAVLGRGLAMAFARVEALLLRAVAGRGAAPSPLPPPPERGAAPFRPSGMLMSGLRLIAGKLLRPLRSSRIRHGHWNIALRRGPEAPDRGDFDLAGYTPLPPDPSTFYADPFVFEEDGRLHLFAEAYPYASAKGVIASAELTPEGAAGPFRNVLERPYHLSYPYVFRREGAIWMAPECSDLGGLELYRATSFPDRWVLEHRLFEDLRLVDPTLFEHGGRLWLLAGMIGEGGSPSDELFAWHAPALAGPWTAHRQNPVKSDCRSARPGGRPMQAGGRLLRPAQCCEQSYGEKLVWMEVTSLTPDEFVEAEIATWAPIGPAATGLHSADLSAAVTAVDFRADLDPGSAA